jgi:DNA-binding transcriptional LysR family regulator
LSLDLLAAMRVFTSVVEAGSFAAAADKLDISRAMATRHVALLESHLGVRLLHRTTRRLALTEAGTQYHQRAAQVLGMVQEAADVVQQQARTPSGTLRVASAVGFQRYVGEAVCIFLRAQPAIQVELSLGERRADLIEEGFDLAVRVTTIIEPGLVARRLARVRTVLCAAPAYLAARGTPHSPQDLADHNCMSYAHKDWRSEWQFRRGSEALTVPVTGSFRASGGSVVAEAAVDGMGIVLEPEFIVCDALRDGRLVPLLPQWQTLELSAFAVYPQRRHLPLKVRAFVDHLVAVFAAPPPWERWRGERDAAPPVGV